jgi:hypothetical protein
MGLPVCRSIIEAQNGRLSVTSSRRSRIGLSDFTAGWSFRRRGVIPGRSARLGYQSSDPAAISCLTVKQGCGANNPAMPVASRGRELGANPCARDEEIKVARVIFDSSANSLLRTLISRPKSPIGLYVVPNDEELMIARHTLSLLSKHFVSKKPMTTIAR